MIKLLLMLTVCFNFMTNKEANDAFAKEPKPIIYMISAPWCGPCQKYKQNVLDPIEKTLQKEAYIVYVDLDKDTELAEKLAKKKKSQIRIPQFYIYKKKDNRWYKGSFNFAGFTNNVNENYKLNQAFLLKNIRGK